MKVAIAKMVGAFWFEPVPAELDGDGAEEVITRHPKQSYVRLRPYEH